MALAALGLLNAVEGTALGTLDGLKEVAIAALDGVAGAEVPRRGLAHLAIFRGLAGVAALGPCNALHARGTVMLKEAGKVLPRLGATGPASFGDVVMPFKSWLALLRILLARKFIRRCGSIGSIGGALDREAGVVELRITQSLGARVF